MFVLTSLFIINLINNLDLKLVNFINRSLNFPTMTAALNQFISRSTERCRPFFQLLHKWKDFSWSEECDKDFEELKAYLALPLVLSRPEKEEVLYAYVVVARHVVSLVLIRVDEGIQKPVYYVSKSLQEAEVK